MPAEARCRAPLARSPFLVGRGRRYDSQHPARPSTEGCNGRPGL